MKTLKPILFTILALFMLAGCAGKSEEILSEMEMYEKAYKSLSANNYEQAIENYKELRATYPYGKYTTQGDIEICYAYYKTQQSEAALPCIDRFLTNHPTHPHIDYAYYLKGLVLLPVRPPKIGERYFKTQEQFSDHDAESAREAYIAFIDVIERFPFSDYADSAKQHLINLVNTFARHDLQVARFYLYRKAYVAAVNRAQKVLKRYESSPHTEEALAVLVYAYEEMQLQDLADDSRRVLAYNFPNSEFITNPSSILDQDIVERAERGGLFGLFR